MINAKATTVIVTSFSAALQKKRKVQIFLVGLDLGFITGLVAVETKEPVVLPEHGLQCYDPSHEGPKHKPFHSRLNGCQTVGPYNKPKTIEIATRNPEIKHVSRRVLGGRFIPLFWPIPLKKLQLRKDKVMSLTGALTCSSSEALSVSVRRDDNHLSANAMGQVFAVLVNIAPHNNTIYHVRPWRGRPSKAAQKPEPWCTQKFTPQNFF